MSSSPEALVNPVMLVWARETSGLQVSAVTKRTGFSWAQLEEWEQGIQRPSISQLRRLSEAYRRPLIVFYLDEAPKGFSIPHDYRTIRDKRPEGYSSSLRFELRRIEYQRKAAIDLAEEDEFPPAPFVGSVKRRGNSEQLGREIREMLGVSLEQQTGANDKYAALSLWKNAVESLGIVVAQFGDVDVSEARGFSLASERAPVIALNIKDVPVARIFTLFHEFAHLLLDQPGVCDLRELPKPHTDHERTERYCNEVAAAAILPDASFRHVMNLGKSPTVRDWPIEDIKRAAARFKVSGEAIARRLVSVGAASFDFFMATREQLQNEREAWLEQPREKKPIRRAPAHTALHRAGGLVTRTVLDAYDRAAITASEASDIFGLRVRHLAKLRELQASAQVSGAADQ